MDIKTPKISNNVFDVIQASIRSIDSMAVYIMNSPSADSKNVATIIDATKNIKKTINAITKSLSDIVKALAELEEENFNAVIDAGSIFMISSIKMAINKNKGDQFKGPALIVASYAKLLSLMAELSQYAQSIDSKAIGKTSEATAFVFKYLYNTQRMIARKSDKLLKLKVVDSINIFFESTNNVISQISNTLLTLGSLIQTFDSIGGRKARRKTRRAIKTIFSIYIDTIVGAIQLGELLFTGQLTRSYLIPKKFRSKTYGVGNILKALVSLIAMSGYFNIVFKLMVPMTEQLNFIGVNRRNIKKGLRTLNTILYGDKKTPGLLEIMTHSRSLSMSRVKKLAITAILITTFVGFSILLRPVISTLVEIGSNKMNIIGGLVLLEMMLVNNDKARIKSLTYTFTQAGKPSNIKNLGYAIILVAGITLLMTMMFVIYSSLNFAGKNYRSIKRGIKATSLILMGSKGFLGIGKQKSLIQIISSINDEDIKNIEKSFKPIAELTALSILLNILTLNLAIIGRRKRQIKRGVKAIRYINRLLEYIADINETIKSRKITTKKIWEVSKILLLVTGLLALISIELTIIGVNVVGILLTIPALLLMRIVLAEIIWISNYLIKKGKNIVKSSAIFGAVGRLLFRLARIFMIFAAGALTLAIIATSTLSMLAIIGGMTLAILAILAISLLPMTKVSATTLAIIGISLSLYVLSITFMKISESTQNMNFKSILLFIGVTTVLIGLFSLMGIASPLMILAVAGAMSMVLISVSLLLLVVPLMLISELDPSDFENAETNATLLIQTSLNIIKGFMNAAGAEVNKGKEPETWVGRILTGTLGSAGALLEAVLSVAFIALTFATVTLLLLTAAELSLLDNISIDPGKILTNTQVVVGTAFDVISAICGKTPPDAVGVKEEKKGLFGSLFKFLGNAVRGLKGVVEGILSFGFVAMTFLTIGMITLIAKNLKYLEGIEINQKIVEAKVQAVVGTANSLINHINESNINKGDVKKAGLTRDFMKQIEKTVGYMSKIGEMNNQGQFDKAIDSYVRFVDKINTVKLENLQTATNMFEKMAEFSKSISGNFEGLADSINDKIMPLLEQLNESLNKTNENIENGSFGVTTVTSGPAAPTSTPAGTPTTAGTPANAPQKDYSRILGEIKQEISKMQKILTDGSQVTVVDTQ